MLKNRMVGKRIRNIIILLMTLAVMIGIYINIRDSRAENLVELTATALDNYGYLETEEFTLNAKQIENDMYEIELPESINNKKIIQTMKATLEDLDTPETEDGQGVATEKELEIVDNKIKLTKEQINTKKINIEVAYDVMLLNKKDNGESEKILLSQTTEADRKEMETTGKIEKTEKLYSQILKYEDEKNKKLIEVKGYMPKDAQLQVEEASKEKLKEVFGDAKIDAAYDIKIIAQVVTQIPADEANPDGKIEEIEETIEINPEDYGEVCEVSIKDANIKEDSQVYHVKEDNTYEQVNVTDNTKENITFEATNFSIYAVVTASEEIENSADDVTNTDTLSEDSIEINFGTNGNTIWAKSQSTSVMITGGGYTGSSITAPYLPSGFSYVDGDLDSGIVIRDSNGNEYVWIEVPRTADVYPTAGINITSFGDDEYTKIENDLHTYTSDYRIDDYGDEGIGIDTAQYNLKKRIMLKSIYQNGGFYVGRYETGIDYNDPGGHRTASGEATQIPVIKPNAYPYNYVSRGQAETLSWMFSTGDFKSNLIYGVQWDLIMKYLETKGTTQEELNNSTSWGNYFDSTWSITSSEQKFYLGNNWSSTPFEKRNRMPILLTTGASNTFSKQNIFDLGGNLDEWTLERDESGKGIARGGNFMGTTEIGATSRYLTEYYAYDDNNISRATGFRVVLYKDGEATSDEILDGSGDSPSDQLILKYQWTQSTTAPTESSFTSTFTNGGTITKSTGTGNNWYLWILAKNSAETKIVRSNAFYLDNIAPTISVSTTSCNWRNTALNVTITASDAHSGLLASNSYQYYLSNSGTKLSGGSWKNYTSGTPVSLNPGISGTYYLFVKRVNDNAENVSTTNGTPITISPTTYQRFGTYQFDYDEPVITVDTESSTWRNTALSVTITASDTGESGLSSSNSYQYYLSNSGTELSGGSWKNYTSGTPVSLNPGISGTYYLFVKRVNDNAENVSTTNGTPITISPTTYQRFGTYQFDYDEPVITVDTESCTWRNTALSVTITASDAEGSGLSSSNSYQYYLSNSGTELSGGIWENYTSGTPISLRPETSGTYYLFIKRINDNMGNTSTTNGTPITISSTTYQRFGAYQFDYDEPVITVDTESCTWRNTALSVTITASDAGGSGLSSSNSYQYYLSNSGTELSGGIWIDYTNGTPVSLNPGTSGTYYLFVKRVNDNMGNASTTNGTPITISSTTYQRFGTYQFDYDEPVITVDTESCTWRNTALSVTITASDAGGSGLSSSNSYQYYLSNSKTELSGGSWKDYTSGMPVSLNPETSGTYYLFIKRINDNMGNTSTTNGTPITISPTTYQRFGAYQFDYTKPTVKYTHQSVDIDQENKKYTMTFTVTDDHYYSSEQLTLDDLTILMKNGQLNSSGNEIVYNLKELSSDGVTITLRADEKIENGKLVGHTYTLTIENLEQAGIKGGHTTADYSGIITVVVPGGKITDEAGNQNDATTITSGINIPDGTGSGVAVDVVDPIWEKVKSTVNFDTQTATLIIKGTDTYFAESTLTNSNDKIKIFMDGIEATSGVTVSLSDATVLEETRLVNGTNTSVQYGVQYTITITGFSTDISQIKVQIPEGTLEDETGNVNKVAEFLLYSSLRSTGTEKDPDDGFLGNTNIKREDIEKVVFLDNITGSTEAGVQQVWDVSEEEDYSIIAWYKETSAPYTVYIGSDSLMAANKNSNFLFAYIGYGESCTATKTIENLELLNTSYATTMFEMFGNHGYRAMTTLDLGSNFNTSRVTDMSYMFYRCGYMAMTAFDLGEKFDTGAVENMHNMFDQFGYTVMPNLDLGDKFYTSSVTNMNNMFSQCGYTAMTNLDLGDNFDTSSVTDMFGMFDRCGYTAMTGLNLGNKFDTSSATNMGSMFAYCGYTKMSNLDLGNNFDTSSATDMGGMFSSCGRTAMTSLDLGNKFDTSNVKDMSFMFSFCGAEKMTSLDLGELFYTTSATNIINMFSYCGNNAMTTLDLGPGFTRIPDKLLDADGNPTEESANSGFMTNCGKSGATIYAPEAIYKNKTSFKLNSGDITTEVGAIAIEKGRTINPIYRPEWTKVSSTIDTTNKTLKVTVKGSAYKTQTIDANTAINYASDVTSTLSSEDITVFVDGVEVTSTVNPTVTVNAGTESTNGTSGKTEVTHTITLSNLEEAVRQAGIPYKEWQGNISIKIGGRGEATSTYTANVLKDEYGNQNMSEIDTTGTWIDVTCKDVDTDHNINGTMFTDFIKPEFTYMASNTTIGDGNHGNTKKVTIVFDVVDKYFSSTNLSTDTNANLITVKVDNDEVNSTVNVNKTLTKVQDITDTVNGVADTKIGERYQLEITGLEQLDENGLSNGYTYSGPMSIAFPSGIISDKSANQNSATTITIGVDDTDGNTQDIQDPNGVIVDVVNPIWELGDVDLENGTIKLRAKDKYFDICTIDETKITVYANGVESTAIVKTLSEPTITSDGVEYTLTLSNISPGELVGFVPVNKDTDGLVVDSEGKAYYASENGGNISITIESGTIKDLSGNTSIEQSFNIGNIDNTKPRIYDVQKMQDASAGTLTFIFNVTDRNYDPTDLIELGEITVWVDGVQVTSIERAFETGYPKPIKLDIDGETGKILGHQYKLVLSNIVEAARQAGKEFLEYSGTIEIRIAEDAAKDLKGNTLNPSTTTISDFVDFIKPEMRYTYQTTDVNKGNKTYTMTFEITDKYYTSGKLTLADLEIQMQNGQKDSSGNAIIYDLKQLATQGEINITFNATDKTATFNKTIDGTITNGTYVIGHTYTLIISNLEQLERKEGFTTADYSGVITVAVPADKIADMAGNKNNATTITSGVNIPGGTLPDDAVVVDVVDPIWEKISSTASAIDPDNKASSTATITFRGTDTYFDTNTLTASNIEVIVNGSKVTSGITKTLSEVTPLTEERIKNNGLGTTEVETVQYGVEYTLTITGFAQNANQVKIRIPAGVLKDETGNGNRETDLILYNVLRSAASEIDGTSAFLGSTGVQRRDIEKVIFVNSEKGLTDTGVKKVWDVSAEQDNSIKAWTTQTSAPYTVYIGSNWEIFANQNSSYLFSYIGYENTCTATETIKNIDLLNVKSVTNMSNMFSYTGYRKMTDLNLGANFDTSNVTNMAAMFYNCGAFAMTGLDLGDKFDTANVTNMEIMFNTCGAGAMTSLDLGNKFDIANVTNMESMFASCGHTAMTSLDLGIKFTQIADLHDNFMIDCGKSGATIYVSESIYKDKTSFKLNSRDTSTASGAIPTSNGVTINPIYKPKWEKVSSTIDTTNKTLSVTVKGSAYESQVIDSNVTINYASNVTSTLGSQDITVFVDGVEVTSTVNPTVAVNAGTESTNGTSRKTEVTHTITLSNLEEAVRQSGKNFKEWQGNISIKIGGRGEATSTYTANVLKDEYGNQNMMETDESGTWIDITYSDTVTDRNTDGIMFTDFIKPEFTYIYSEADIDRTNKQVKILFSVTDKYFASSSLTTDDLTVLIDGELPGDTNGNGVIDNDETLAITKTLTETSTITGTVNGETKTIGKTYTLLLKDLEQSTVASGKNYLDYSGVITVAIPEGKVTDNSGNINDGATITMGNNLPNAGTSTQNTAPYLPEGYTYVEGTDLSTGLVIEDGLGNQYVWIEVPRTTAIYQTAGLEITSFTNEEFALIENDLRSYTNIALDGTYIDEYYSDEITGLTENEYNTQKKKMLKSVYLYGGFYIGRYETGIADEPRTSSGETIQIPVIQSNAYPYTYITTSQAQTLSSSFSADGYTSSLMFGVQWDLVMSYLMRRVPKNAVINDSSSWGNYSNATYTISDSDIKYSTNGTMWQSAPYNHNPGNIAILSTGASERFKLQNIYDLAGNLAELTLESRINESGGANVIRGGDCSYLGSGGPAGSRKTFKFDLSTGFRVALYKDEGAGAVVADVVDPIWTLGEITQNLASKSATIKLSATDKYFKECTIDEDDITVYVNGVESTSVEKDISSILPTDITDTINESNIVVGKEYTLTLSNLESTVGGGYETFIPSNLDDLNNTEEFKYRSENGGDITIKIAAGTIKDKYENTSQEKEFDVGNMDITKPEVYKVQTIKDTDAKTETIIFNVTDKNYDSTDLITLDEITVFVDGEQVDSLTKVLSSKEIKITNEEITNVVGHQYTLVLSDIVEAAKQAGKDYLEYSGTIEIKIAEDAAKDTGGNTLNPATTTIGDFVDFIKPVIEPITVADSINTIDKTYTISFKIIDKYLDTTNMLTTNEIIVYVDGEEASSISKNLTSTPIMATFKKTIDGSVEETATNHTIGYIYTLVLSDFEQTEKQSGKDFMEWSGTVKIEIAQNAVNDTTGNTLDEDVTKRTINGEYVDFIKPVVEKVSSTIDATAKTETIRFNVMDKYLDISDELDDTKISVYVDEELVSNMTKTLTKVQDFTVTVNGDSNHIVGQQYQLVLSGFEQSSRNASNYKDWSGTVSIELAQNAVKDTSGNILDSDTTKRTVVGDFVDFIKPDLQYTHQTTDINTGNKKYTMKFDVTDKYYTNGQFTAQDIADGKIEILMQNGQKDADGNLIVYNLKDEPVTITVRAEEIRVPSMKITNISGQVVTATDQVIGHTYAITISDLEQLERKSGLTTADYSGVITVAVAGNEIKDRGPSGDGTNANGNVATTITSGVNIPGGTDAVVVDVVDPIWERVSSSAYAIDPANKASSTATITFRGTDTYFDTNTLTASNIKVIVNGSEVTSGITKTLSEVTPLTEERIANNGLGTTEVETVQYGVEYTLTITGFAQNANQVKIGIPAGVLTDKTGNTNKETELILYNCLKLTSSETEITSGFLGGIQRQNIKQVVFVNSAEGSKEAGVQNVWDVSAQNDNSILAWYNETSVPYTVYIGSDWEIFANQNSSYLFARIGANTSSGIEEKIARIDLLNVESVTNMEYMFYDIGQKADITILNLGSQFDTSNVTSMKGMFAFTDSITNLNLGDKFDTRNVTNMSGMFAGTENITELNLGNEFDTSNVTDMSSMFSYCGTESMTSLNLGNKFNTSNVTSMAYMFDKCGYTAMTSLDLGDKFDTSKVIDMNNMFTECGYTAMTSLDLGDKFDTRNVTNMSDMFSDCGYTAMTSLDLGDLFYTTKVTDMTNMFKGCGRTEMTTLDLGPAFTRIAPTYTDFMTDCGNSSLVIYAPEKIYHDKNTFKTN